LRRLVSAIWSEIFPFNQWGVFESFDVASDPEHLKEGDALLLLGGEDIHPELYKQGRSSKSGASIRPSWRDQVEMELIKRAKAMQLPIIGICRGAQIMCAAAGGSLWQHVDGHAGRWHTVIDAEGEILKVNSIHHQMLNLEGSDGVLLAKPLERIAKKGCTVDLLGRDVKEDIKEEPEAVWFPSLRGLAVQWHPEMMDTHYTAQAWVRDRYLQFINDI
jgi:putative glutamine amidotransferase